MGLARVTSFITYFTGAEDQGQSVCHFDLITIYFANPCRDLSFPKNVLQLSSHAAVRIDATLFLRVLIYY